MNTVITMEEARDGFRFRPWVLVWCAAFVVTLALYLARDLWPTAWQYPRDWEIPLRYWISSFMKWLVNDFDLGLFTFKEFTRSIAWLLDWPLSTAQDLLSSGFEFSIGNRTMTLPSLSWIAVVGLVAILGHYASGRGLALLVGGCFLYLAAFGQWESAMVTLSSIAIAVPIGVVLGLSVGIAGFRSRRAEAIITPILDLMQTVPVFAYLVPVLFLFGFGPVAAMIATIIYATPPMVRCTILSLRMVPSELIDFGRMAGSTRRQLLWLVQIPSARPTLMVGVNQVIMLSLNMVIIASMIGAGGLGFDVLSSLKRLNIGAGVEAGLAITLLAIALDRLSQAFVNRPPPEHEEQPAGFYRRHPHLIVATILIVGTTLLGFMLEPFQTYPNNVKPPTVQASLIPPS